jgi:hypothetical protein
VDFRGRTREQHVAAVRAAHEATMRHSTARAWFNWSSGRRPPPVPELPTEMGGEVIVDLGRDRVVFDAADGGDILDGGRVYSPSSGDGERYTVLGRPDDPMGIGTPSWLLALPYGLLRARSPKKQGVVPGELWQRYDCQCDIRAAAAHRDRALEEPKLPLHVLPVAIWVDGEGRLRQVSAKWGSPYAGVRLRDFDGPAPVEIPPAEKIVGA